MNAEAAIAVIDAILEPNRLNDLQAKIFQRVWAGEKYPDIAEALGYDANYVKDIGAKLWKQLSQILGERVTKSNIQSIIRHHGATLTATFTLETSDLSASPQASGLETLQTAPSSRVDDWDEQIDTAGFLGREQEVALISEWLQEKSSRLIVIFGLAGQGKTSITAKVSQEMQQQFDGMIWRSLKHLPSLSLLLDDLLKSLQLRPPTANTEAAAESPIQAKINCLIDALTRRRYLIVLDHIGPLISAEQAGGANLQDSYISLLQQLGTTRHQSCVLITCRNLPNEIIPRAEDLGTIRTVHLKPCPAQYIQTLLDSQGSFQGTPEDWQALTEQYGGNPFALQIVSTTILDFFQGNVSDFLAEEQVVFEGLSAFLQQQWDQLNPAERWVLYYLAARREPVTFRDIKDDTLKGSLQRRLSENLARLERRSLIQRHSSAGVVTFSLQTAVLEYVNFRLIDALTQELSTSQFHLLEQLPLLKASRPTRQQLEQRQRLLQPILDQLQSVLPGGLELSEHLRALIHTLQHQAQDAHHSFEPCYAAGNLVNLLSQTQASLNNLNLAYLPLWEVNLSATSLHDVTLAHCDLSRTIFANAFGGVTTVAFSPTGDRFVTGHETGQLVLWDTDEGRPMQWLKGQQSWVWSVCWSPDGQSILSAGEDQTLHVWSSETGLPQHVLKGHTDRIWQVVCSTPTIALTASSDQTVKVWNIETGDCIQTLTGHQGDVTALATGLKPGQVLSGGADQTLRLWDVESGAQLDLWQTTQGGIWAIAVCQQTESIYTAGDGGIVEIWHLENSEPLGRLEAAAFKRIWSLAVSPSDGDLVAAGNSSRSDRAQVVRWNLNSKQLEQQFFGHEGRVWCVDYARVTTPTNAHDSHQGERIITAGSDNTIRLWDREQDSALLTLRSYANWACEVAYLPPASSNDKAIIAGAYNDGNLYLWNLEQPLSEQVELNCHPTRLMQGHQQPVWALASSPTGSHLISGSEDGTLRYWDMQSGVCQSVLKGHGSRVWAVAWSQDGEMIASGSGDRTVKLWDADSGHCRYTLTGHQSRIWTVAFSPDHRWVASGSSDQTLKLWNRETGNCDQTLIGHQSLILSLAFHPEKSVLASAGGDGTCRLWDLETGDCSATISIPINRIWAIAWSPDGQDLALAGDNGAILRWHYPSQDWKPALKESAVAADQGSPMGASVIWSLTYNLDGMQIMSGSQDGIIRVWALQTEQIIHRLQPKRLYDGLDIMDATGLTTAQIETLQSLGAQS